MSALLNGSLKLIPASDLLQFLAQRGLTGTLDVESDGQSARIVFDAFRIVWAQSSNTRDMLESVLEAFAWGTGTFTFLESAEIPETVVLPPLNLVDVVMEASRRMELSTPFPDDTVFSVVVNSDTPQIKLTAEEFKLIFLLTTPRAVTELAETLRLSSGEITRRLRALMNLGIVVSNVKAASPQVTLEQPLPSTPSRRRQTLVGSLTPDYSPDNVYPLLESEQTIGRSPENGICIADASVSSRHASIVRTADGFVLEDNQSRNGTFVNGERLHDRRLLADGDLIRLGKVILTFNVARQNDERSSTTGWGGGGRLV